MARQLWCVRCGEDRIEQLATTVVDGDPLCNAHALRSSAPPDPEDVAVAAEDLKRCPYGCGEQKHRGLCAEGRKARGSISAPMLEERGILLAVEVSPEIDLPIRRRDATAPFNPGSGIMQATEFRVVKRSELPGVKRRESYHLNQRVFEAMLAARPEAVEVPVANMKAGVNLRRRIQLIARAKGLETDWSRTPDSKLFYFWLVDPARSASAPCNGVTR